MKTLFILLLFFSSLTNQLQPAQSTCHQLCQDCSSGSCNNCYSNFQANAPTSSTCSCPSGYYLDSNICLFCALNCQACSSATTCTKCSPGFSLHQGNCLLQYFGAQTPWNTYEICQDFSAGSTESVIDTTGFVADLPDRMNFVTCQNVKIIPDNQIQKLPVVTIGSGEPFMKQINGLPYHQWVHIHLQFPIIDQFSQKILLTIDDDDLNPIQLQFSTAQRLYNLCGDQSIADNMGLFQIKVSHTAPSIKISVNSEVSPATIGIYSFEVDVGTCDRNCLTCKSPSQCLSCPSNMVLDSQTSTCQCASTAISTSYGCIDSCRLGYTYIPGVQRCVLSERYISHCLTLDTQGQFTCLRCQPAYFRTQEGGCALQCLASGQYPNVDTSSPDGVPIYECLQCPQNCTSCASDSACLTCSSTFLLSNGQCLPQCPSGSTNLDGRCVPDSETLIGCQITASSTSCQKCQSGFWLHQGQCLTSCPPATYRQIQALDGNSSCLPCAENCISCFSDNACYQCISSQYSLEDGVCVQPSLTCENGQYYDRNVRRCIDCLPGCLSCYKTLCLSCSEGFFLDNGLCVETCSSQQKYKQIDEQLSEGNGFCLWGHPECETYSNSMDGNCQQCRNMNTPLVIGSSEKTCDQSCITGQSVDNNGNCYVPSSPSIANCDDIDEQQSRCLKCADSYYVDENGQCTQDCGVEWTHDSVQCVKCPSSCSTCDLLGFCSDWIQTPSDVSCPSNCELCVNGGTTCVKCDDSTYLDKQTGTCSSECAQKYFGNQVSGECVPCRPGCSRCSSFNECQECEHIVDMENKVVLFLSYNRCVKECPQNSYRSAINQLNPDTMVVSHINTCKQCSSTCKTCYGPHDYQCITCYHGYKLDHTTCKQQCPIYKYPDIYAHCDWCHPACKYCFGPADFQCLQCTHDRYVYRSECYVGSCPSATYLADPSILKCEDCSYGCSICQSSTQCTQCFGGYYLMNGECLNSCPLGYYFSWTNNQCTQCVDNCQSCWGQSCYLCSEGYSLHNGQCQQNCPPSTYVLDYYYGSECRACPFQCATCTSYHNCQSCNSGYTLNAYNQCTQFCPPAHYFQASTDQCTECMDNCVLCINSGSCQRCKKWYKLSTDMSECLENCPPGTYVVSTTNSNNQYCMPCAEHCLSCTSFFHCTECENGMIEMNGICTDEQPCTLQNCDICSDSSKCAICTYPFIMYPVAQTCVEQCSTGYYQDNSICRKCDSTCLQCSSRDTCDQCADGFVKYNGQCVINCPAGLVQQNDQCVSCPLWCRSCSDSSHCNSCYLPAILHGDICINQCPASTYYSVLNHACLPCSENCQICSSPTSCQACAPSYILNPDGTCHQSCPTGTYQSINAVTGKIDCIDCEFPCKRCLSEDECIECFNGYPLNTDTDYCQFSCPSGTFHNQQKNQCDECDSLCLECISDSTTCTACHEGYYQIDGTCVLQCPQGTYPTIQDPTTPGSSRFCLPCGAYCLICDSSHQCTSCSQNYYLFDGVCVQDQCPPGYYEDDSINVCTQCNPPCLTCDGNSFFDCESCKNGFYLYMGVCVQECPDGYYKHDSSRTCRKCSDQCLTCSTFDECITCEGPCDPIHPICSSQVQQNCESCSIDQNGDEICQNCSPGFYLQNGVCVQMCEEATYEDIATGNCEPCSEGCNFCNSPTSCIECDDSYFLYNGICYMECPDQTITDPFTNICHDDPCLHYSLSGDCTNCVSPYLLNDGSCVEFCPEGTFQSNLQCMDCMDGCQACYSIDFCSTCEEGYYFNQGICVQQCPTGTFPNDDYNICNNCDDKCLICSSFSQCQKCASGYYFNQIDGSQSGMCLPNCAQGHFENVDTQQCMICDDGCLQCTSSTNCNNCQSPLILFHGQCIQQCPELGYYLSEGTNTCKPCRINCEICYYEAGESMCSACKEGFYLNTQTGRCVQNCPSGYYADVVTQQCIVCDVDAGCEECEAPGDYCTSCPEGSYILKGICYENQCPSGYYISNQQCLECDSSCKQCENFPDYCTDCQDGSVLVIGNMCSHQCPSGQYMTQDSTCKDCSDQCAQCFGPALDQCTSCEADLILQDNECIHECPQNTFHDEETNECRECSHSCATCNGASPLDCVTCPPTFYLLINGQDQVCVKNCPPSFYRNNGTMECTECDSSCKTCVNETFCKSCADGYVLQTDGTCIIVTPSEECEQGQFYNSFNQSCLECPEQCQTCTSATECTTCASGLFKVESMCVPSCPAGTYLNINANTCDQCELANCKKCTSATECGQCNNDYVLHQNQCIAECPIGYQALNGKCRQDNVQENETCAQKGWFILNGECLQFCPITSYAANSTHCEPCGPSCMTCISETECTNCIDNYIYLNGNCYIRCPPGYAQDETGTLCLPCISDNCAICVSESNIDCNECQSGFYQHHQQCLQECPEGYYENDQNNTCTHCADLCLSCSDSISCDECINEQLSPPYCSEPCSVGQYTTAPGQCQDCNPNCERCSGPLISDCITCADGLVKVNGQCRSSCPQGYFIDQNLNECHQCRQGCLTCNANLQCVQCFSPLILFSGHCIENCDDLSSPNQDFYQDIETLQCEQCPQDCIECESPQCIQCSADFILHNGQCVQECPDPYYNSYGQCIRCHQNCQICTSYDQCTQCASPLINLDGFCVEQCGFGQFHNEVENTCEPCSAPHCQACNTSQTNPATDKCQSCNPPFMLSEINTCTECVPGYLYKPLSQSCVRCDDSCQQCETTIYNCIACYGSAYLLDGECMDECPEGYYGAESICQPCNIENCQVCEVITSEPECTQCKEGFYSLTKTNANNVQTISCVSECAEGTYADYTSMSCLQCEDNCVQCVDGSHCEECETDFLLYNDMCVDQCPVETFDNGAGECLECPNKCIECTSQTNCTECRQNYVVDENDLCEVVPQCTDGQFYQSSTNQCVECPSLCLTCANSSYCNSCQTDTFMDDNLCVEQCTAPRTYPDSETQKCQSCSLFCLICQSADVCDQCDPDHFLHQGQCMGNCDEGQYANNGVCVPCEVSNCMLCDSAVQCYQCQSNYRLIHTMSGGADELECVMNCPQGYFESTSQMEGGNTEIDTCEHCSQNCLQCVDETECSLCDESSSQPLLYNAQCVDTCPEGTYENNGECDSCSDNCLSCTDDDSCNECDGDSFLYHSNSRSYCVQECPSPYFGKEETRQCERCGDNCFRCINELECTECVSSSYELIDGECIHRNCVNCAVCNEDSNRCQQCESDYYLYENTRCYEHCPGDTYGNNDTMRCEGCMDHCVLCHQASTCDQCQDTYNWTSASSQCLSEAYLEFGNWSNMSSFTSNITYYMVAVYLGTATGPMAFGELTTTYFNIEFCQFVLFHANATGGNPQVQQFLTSLEGMSLTNNAGDQNSTDNSTQSASRRRMLAASNLADPSNFLQVNAFIFLLIGIFAAMYLGIYIFQRNIDSCCPTCPKVFFYANQICEYIKKRFFWIYFDFLAWIAYLPFLYFGIVQLKNFNFNNFLNGFSSLLSVVIVVVLPLYPVFMTYLLKKNYNHLVLENDQIVEMSLKPYVQKVKRPQTVIMEGDQFKYFTFENMRLIINPLKYFRKFVFVLVIAICPFPVTTISILIGLNVVFIVYLSVFRPRLMPYLVFDFIIEGILLCFEIFMLTYLLLGGQKISAMSIVAHAVGFITANLSLLAAIILNLIAYYKIIMCCYDLYKHLKQKAEEKEKKDLKGEEQSQMNPDITKGLQKDKELGSNIRRNQDQVTEEDIDDNRRGLMDDKEIFQFNDGSNITSPLKRSVGGLPDLKKSKRKSELEDEDLESGRLKDKELREFSGHKKRQSLDDDGLTEQDPELRSSINNSNILRDKQLYKGQVDQALRMSRGGQIPDLKGSISPRKHVGSIDNKDKTKLNHINQSQQELSSNYSAVSHFHLVDDGNLKEKNGQSLKRKRPDDQELIVADGMIKERQKDKYKRTKTNIDEEGELQDAKMREKNKKNPMDINLLDAQFTERNKKQKMNNGEDNDLEEGQFKQRNRVQNAKSNNDIDQAGFYERSNGNRGKGDENNYDDQLQEEVLGKKSKRVNNLIPQQKGHKGSSRDLEQGQFKDRNKNQQLFFDDAAYDDLQNGPYNVAVKEVEKKKKQSDQQFADFSEASPQQNLSKKTIEELKLNQKLKKNLRKQNSDDQDGQIPQGNVKSRKAKPSNNKQITRQKDNGQIPQANTKSRKTITSKKQIERSQNDIEGTIEGGTLVERKNNKYKRNKGNGENGEENIDGKMKDMVTKKRVKNDQQQHESFEEDEVKFKQISPVKRRKDRHQDEDVEEQQLGNKHRKHKHRDILDDDNELGDQYERKQKEEERKRKKGNLNINDNESGDFDDTYSGIKRKNKNNAFLLDPKRANKMMDSMGDDFEGSDYEERPSSKQGTARSRGKGHLGVHDSSNIESGEESDSSVRRQRQSAVQRLRKKNNDLLNIDNKSQFSEEEITTPRGSVIKKPKKYKREKSGILNIKNKDRDEEIDEIRL